VSSKLGLPTMPSPDLRRIVDALYRSDSGRILATLIRWLGGDLELAEEAMHEAFAAALETWPETGVPDKPRPWLLSTGRFKAIDVIRRRGRSSAAYAGLVVALEPRADEEPRPSTRWRTTVFGSSSPAVIPRFRPRRRSRSPCVRCAG
jgi:RNA polymerase sigma-70 factor (ECF subfamily)